MSLFYEDELGRLSRLAVAERHTLQCELFKVTGAVDLTEKMAEIGKREIY